MTQNPKFKNFIMIALPISFFFSEIGSNDVMSDDYENQNDFFFATDDDTNELYAEYGDFCRANYIYDEDIVIMVLIDVEEKSVDQIIGTRQHLCEIWNMVREPVSYSIVDDVAVKIDEVFDYSLN